MFQLRPRRSSPPSSCSVKPMVKSLTALVRAVSNSGSTPSSVETARAVCSMRGYKRMGY